jgi:hypothetical protein
MSFSKVRNFGKAKASPASGESGQWQVLLNDNLKEKSQNSESASSLRIWLLAPP